jgi:hypothetical protein
MQNRQSDKQGLGNNPYINNQQNTQELKSMRTPMQQNPYYNTNNQNINQQAMQQSSNADSLLSNFDTSNFLKGALIGAVGAYLLTNENAQKSIFKTFAKGSDMLGAGIEELKERMEDAKAELQAEQETKA